MERPREHIIQSESDRFLSKFFDPWVVNVFHNDYGLDFNIEITENGKTIGRPFYVQNKGTDHLQTNETHVKFRIKVKYLLYYEKIIIPVLLFRYDAQQDISYWIHLQSYIREVLSLDVPSWKTQETITLYIPKTQKVTDLDLMKTMILDAYNQNIHNHTQKLLWYQGIELSLDDAAKMELIIKENEKKLDYRLLHLSKLNFQEDNPDLVIKNLQKIINKGTKSKELLIAIESLITMKIPSTFQIQEEILELSRKGSNIAKEIKDEIRILRFSFYPLWIEYVRLNRQQAPISATLIKSINSNQNQVFRLEEKIRLQKEISNVEIKITNLLSQLFSKNDLYYLLYFKLQLLFVGNVSIYSMQGVIGVSYLKPFLENQKPILKNLLSILNAIQDSDLRLYGIVQVGARYELFDKPLALKTYKQGLDLSMELNHLFYQKKIKYIIKTFEDFGKYTHINDNPNLTQIAKIFQTSGIPHENIDQADPTYVFNFCRYLEMAYYPSTQSMAKFIYFKDKKKIYCIKKNKCKTSNDLISLFQDFQSENCTQCQYHEKPHEKKMIFLKDLDIYSRKLQYF